ncbi:MAG: hypothetical protein GY720_14090 [bacterium]|nr:hypothetical protein [bacterium]
MADYLGLIEQCEQLYADACFDGESVPDSSLADWIDGIASSMQVDKEVARELRRVLRATQKLRDFWLAPATGRPPDHGDWRTRVDIGLGIKAWRPLLEIARHGLQRQPSEELFADVKERFRVVMGERWMDGVDYEGWLGERDR